MSGRLDRIYARFEERFRGPRDEILARLQVYEPLLALVEQPGRPSSAVDYGCGRGEWLQLLKDRGWEARGVDTNTGMLAIAIDHGLRAEKADAIAHVSGLEDASIDIISAFHLAEHLPMETLLVFIREALRVVRPSGVVIIETPNAENLLVSSTHFYLDPTHERPLPPLLLQFLVQDAGATIAEILRLNGESTPSPEPGSVTAALRPMFTKSLDYAVIGSRSTDPALQEAIRMFTLTASQAVPVDLGMFTAIDERTGRHEAVVAGLTGSEATRTEAVARLQRSTDAVATRLQQGLSSLSDRHDRAEIASERLHDEIRLLASRVTELASEVSVREQLEDANIRLALLSNQTALHEAELEAQLHALRHNLQQTAQVLADDLLQKSQLTRQLADMYESTSWRLTKPVRMLSDFLRNVRGRRIVEGRSTAPVNHSPLGIQRRRDDMMIDPCPSALTAWQALYAEGAAGNRS